MRVLLCTLLVGLTVGAHAAAPAPVTSGRVGLGQDTATSPPMLRNLRLSDPLVRQKYLNEPDMLRFLRATYSEGCARGVFNQASAQIKRDPERRFPAELKASLQKLTDSQRIWKMSSFELEMLFGPAYVHAATYCDCLMREVSDVDLVNPRKGLEVAEAISPAVQRSCDQQATEKTEALSAKAKAAKN